MPKRYDPRLTGPSIRLLKGRRIVFCAVQSGTRRPPPKDDEALAGAMLKLANDSDLRVTIGAENRKRVKEKYAAARMCEQTVAILKTQFGEEFDVH